MIRGGSAVTSASYMNEGLKDVGTKMTREKLVLEQWFLKCGARTSESNHRQK